MNGTNKPSGDAPKAAFIVRFVRFAKSFGVAVGALVAATPIVAQLLDIVPTYVTQSKTLSVSATFCAYLGLLILIAMRPWIARALFPPTRALDDIQAERQGIYSLGVPIGLVVIAIICYVGWRVSLSYSIDRAAMEFAKVTEGSSLWDALDDQDRATAFLFGHTEDKMAEVTGTASDREKGGGRDKSVRFETQAGVASVLKETPSQAIPYRFLVEGFYILMFVGATLAFVWAGLVEFIRKEHGVDLPRAAAHYFALRAHDLTSTGGAAASTSGGEVRSPRFKLFWTQDEGKPTLIGQTWGPYCPDHQSVLLRYDGQRDDCHHWYCARKISDKETVIHTWTGQYDDLALADAAREEAKRQLARLE